MTTRHDIIRRITEALTPLYGHDEARSIALLTAAGLGGVSRTQLLADPGAELELEGLDDVIARLAAGRPVQYELGEAEFCGMSFKVREGVLIPRPETEELVEWVTSEHPTARRLLDVGTGSGCIAIALKRRLPRAEVAAADIADEALAVAAENSRRLEAPIELRRADALGNLAECFAGTFDVIVSNPPYVPRSDAAAMHPNVRDYEPPGALFVPDDDPLLFYRAIARQARRMLAPDGGLYFEIYERAGETMRRMLLEEGYAEVRIRRDLFGRERMASARLAAPQAGLKPCAPARRGRGGCAPRRSPPRGACGASSRRPVRRFRSRALRPGRACGAPAVRWRGRRAAGRRRGRRALRGVRSRARWDASPRRRSGEHRGDWRR